MSVAISLQIHFCLEIVLAIKVWHLLARLDVPPVWRLSDRFDAIWRDRPGEHDSLAALVELDSVHVAAVVEQRSHWVQRGPYHLHHIAGDVVSSVKSSWRNHTSGTLLFSFHSALPLNSTLVPLVLTARPPLYYNVTTATLNCLSLLTSRSSCTPPHATMIMWWNVYINVPRSPCWYRQVQYVAMSEVNA